MPVPWRLNQPQRSRFMKFALKASLHSSLMKWDNAAISNRSVNGRSIGAGSTFWAGCAVLVARWPSAPAKCNKNLKYNLYFNTSVSIVTGCFFRASCVHTQSTGDVNVMSIPLLRLELRSRIGSFSAHVRRASFYITCMVLILQVVLRTGDTSSYLYWKAPWRLLGHVRWVWSDKENRNGSRFSRQVQPALICGCLAKSESQAASGAN